MPSLQKLTVSAVCICTLLILFVVLYQSNYLLELYYFNQLPDLVPPCSLARSEAEVISSIGQLGTERSIDKLIQCVFVCECREHQLDPFAVTTDCIDDALIGLGFRALPKCLEALCRSKDENDRVLHRMANIVFRIYHPNEHIIIMSLYDYHVLVNEIRGDAQMPPSARAAAENAHDCLERL